MHCPASWIWGSVPQCMGSADCLATGQSTVWLFRLWGATAQETPPHCLEATSQVVLGCLGQKYRGSFTFLCSELHTCPFTRAQPTGGGHDLCWFCLCRWVKNLSINAQEQIVFSYPSLCHYNFLGKKHPFHACTWILLCDCFFNKVLLMLLGDNNIILVK